MTGRRSNTAQARIAVEDILLTILGLGAGPLLWWMGQLWQQLPTASSTQTLEYWIALICGLLGGALCVMWTVFLLAEIGRASCRERVCSGGVEVCLCDSA